jgi:Tfp pilus assembly protein PilF
MALEIDDALPDAHTALAITYLFDDWNWEAAERELKRAIGSDPGEPTSRSIHGFYLAAMNRLPEALASVQRGQELDPRAAPRRNEVAMCYNWMRQPDQAIAEAKKALELDPKFFLAFAELGRAYVQLKMYDEAIAVMKGQQHPRIRGVLGYVYAAAGRTEDAQKVMEELRGAPLRRFGDAFAMARINAALGENKLAFECLREACKERDPLVIWLNVDPTLQSLRHDPQFAEVLKEMDLPP